MSESQFRFQTLVRRDLLWLLPLMFVVWVGLAMAGLDVDSSFLAGLSSAVIGVTAYAYREACRDIRFWATIGFYSLVHIVAIYTFGGDWLPSPTIAISPLFLLDYMVMAWLFPKVSRINFNYE
ncbi:MAG: hypothetical protein APF78_03890 [Sphingomonadales bacterium BRH_c3]|nr:MAG: hypothetical protein APF78_03890 [Sphingomonadales bacterium BRH_c3]